MKTISNPIYSFLPTNSNTINCRTTEKMSLRRDSWWNWPSLMEPTETLHPEA